MVLVSADSKLAVAKVRNDSRVAVILLHRAALEFNLRPLTLLLGLVGYFHIYVMILKSCC